MLQILLSLALLVSMAVSTLRGQDSAQLALGTRVRVWTDADALRQSIGKPTVGTLNLWTADSVVINTGSRGVLTIPTSTVTRLDQSTGRIRKGPAVAVGAALGLLTGGTVGLVSAYAGTDNRSCQLMCASEDRDVMMGALLGGLGMVLGGVAGALFAGDVWQPVQLPRR